MDNVKIASELVRMARELESAGRFQGMNKARDFLFIPKGLSKQVYKYIVETREAMRQDGNAAGADSFFVDARNALEGLKDVFKKVERDRY